MGKRGEGWFLMQMGLLALVLGAPRSYHFARTGWLRALGLVILAMGGILGAGGARKLGNNLTPFPKPKEDGQLVTDGVYGLVRHPIYSGLIFGTLGWSLWDGNALRLGLTALLLGFFDLKARHEERWLVAKYPGYVAYRLRVKRLIPWLY
jgi:protein-S-isoprenylcysteine O-methyltransferase Ste14